MIISVPHNSLVCMKYIVSILLANEIKTIFINFSLFISFASSNRNNIGLPSKREWIEMDSDFRKYWFTNVKMNFSILNAFLFIYRNCIEYISMPFNLKIIFFCALWILFNLKFWIGNAVFQSNCMRLNLIEFKKSIRYLKYAYE